MQWWISVSPLSREQEDQMTPEQIEHYRLASYPAPVEGLNFFQDLADFDRASMMGDGYPYYFVMSMADVLVELRAVYEQHQHQPPEGFYMAWQRIEQLPDDLVVFVTAWDLS
ncbi:MAG: hypothetical protein Q4B71_00180 [Cardiobacteriaceae bacterium]|nr:hypothetical protein [Cardiobacteriaceae bacterium]